MSQKLHFPNLDALRFFAFLAVFVSHCAVFLSMTNVDWSIKKTFLVHGDLGVNFFFVLSGFLISFLLFTEKSKTNNISLKHFYIRRVLRIWPLYFITLILGFFVFAKIAIHIPNLTLLAPLEKLPMYVFLLANIDQAYELVPISVILAVLWSISIEEQFYLLWPIILKKVNFKNIPLILAFVIIGTYIFRYFHIDNSQIVEYHTLSVFSDLAVGCLIGYYSFFSEKFKDKIMKLSKYIISLIYILLICFIPLRNIYSTFLPEFIRPFASSLEPVIFSIIFAMIILEQIYSTNSIFKVGKNKIFTWLGKISYGLYCYHMIGLIVTLMIFKNFTSLELKSIWIFLGIAVTGFILTVAIASLSYRYIESPLLRLKDKFGHAK